MRVSHLQVDKKVLADLWSLTVNVLVRKLKTDEEGSYLVLDEQWAFIRKDWESLFAKGGEANAYVFFSVFFLSISLVFFSFFFLSISLFFLLFFYMYTTHRFKYNKWVVEDKLAERINNQRQAAAEKWLGESSNRTKLLVRLYVFFLFFPHFVAAMFPRWYFLGRWIQGGGDQGTAAPKGRANANIDFEKKFTTSR